MKNVTLVKLQSEYIEVDDLINHYQRPVVSGEPKTMIANSNEYVPDCYRVENIPIQRVVDRGVEHYIAVENKVWEYLYYIENPVTAKTQEAKIKSLTERCDIQFQKRAVEQRECNLSKYKVCNASLLTRIKWVFTGVKF